MTPQDFITKWSPGGPAFHLNEEQGAQSHFIDLCDVLGVPRPGSEDGYIFEKQTLVLGDTRGYADVFKRGTFAWENKAPGKNLDSALKQLLNYSSALSNPPILVVCDRLQIRVQTQFTGHPTEKFTVLLAELALPDKLAQLRRIWLDPESFRPKITSRDITEVAAKSFATLADSLRKTFKAPSDAGGPESAAYKQSVQAHADDVAHFLTQCLFCFFAEDVGLLPDRMFDGLVNNRKLTSDKLTGGMSNLFNIMRDGGMYGNDDIPWFNGGLFKTVKVPLLTVLDVTELRNAAALNWSAIDVSIFGTLFERGLDPAKRSQLGAHYTDPATIMRIIEPVLQRPLLQMWELLAHELTGLMVKSKRKNDANYKLALAKFVGWLDHLKSFRVLDPACGSGNFLFLGLKALKDIEHKTHLEAAAMGLDMQADLVTGPHNMLGIELNEYAAELARVTVWIGELQWRLSHGYEFKKNPVLEPLDNIECRDALLAFVDSSVAGRGNGNEARVGQTPAAHTLRFLKSPQMSAPPVPRHVGTEGSNLGSDPRPKAAGSDPNLGASNLRIQLTKAVEASWPASSIVIGNPPFLGGSKKRRELGDAYFEALDTVFAGRVPGGADLVCYWFDKARLAIETKGLGAAGLVATQSIRSGSNRVVLDAIRNKTRIFDAWSDEPWVNNGAAVRVSLVSFGWGECCFLNGQRVEQITAELGSSNASDMSLAKPLPENAAVAFKGAEKSGSFEIPGELARKWLRLPNPHGKSNADVLKPWFNGNDIVDGRPCDHWVVDFGVSTSEAEAALYEAPFAYVLKEVKPIRMQNKDRGRRENWWRFGRNGAEMRAGVNGLPRYLVTVRTAKHRTFVWFKPSCSPDSRLFVIARDDDTTLGVLSSRLHEAWSLANASMHGVGNDPTYNAKSCFETFPFPTNGLKVRGSAAAIAQAAKRLNDLREAWLNPPDWTDRIPEVTPLGMTSSPYPDRILSKPGHEKDLAERTLTKLYNARPAWLDAAHKALDEAVAVAYGWADYTPDMPDEEVLNRLLALNLGRASGEKTIDTKK